MQTFLLSNNLTQRNYVEPYSGGCGLALNLLFGGHVSHIHLNDLDRAVWAFWKATIDFTDELVELINDTPVTMNVWEAQREIQFRKGEADIIELGFSTFFLNRTNRSGIIHSGGVIGGKAQDGAWKMDCRFNKEDLISRIKRISQYKNRISLYNEDAESFLVDIEKNAPASSIIYIDPPYYEKGSQLYKNSYKPNDHERISEIVLSLNNPWIMTYDNVEPIRRLYESCDSVELNIGYSVQTKRRGSEILVVSKGLQLPHDEVVAAH